MSDTRSTGAGDPAPRDARSVTLLDVARDAGVSRSTVSLVLRDSPLVADVTRSRVRASLRRLGYVYHRQAASLRSARSNMVGLIVSDLANPYFAELAVGIDEVLNGAGIVSLLGQSSDSAPVQARLIQTMREHGVDGIVLHPAISTSPDAIVRLHDSHIPLVLVSRRIPGVDADFVGTDNSLGASLATDYLLGLGHTQFAFVGGPSNSTARAERVDGVRQALATRRLTLPASLEVTTSTTRKGGYDAIRQLMGLAQRPSAVLCYNDVVAFGVMLGLRAMGLEPGRDCSVVGFDDVEEATLEHPPLTTLGTDPTETGRRAARLLMSRIADPDQPPLHSIAAPRLIVRGSTGPPRDAMRESGVT